MISIKKLKRPTKRSGYILPPEGSTEIRGMVITNTNSFNVWIDKFTNKKTTKGK